MNDRHTEGSTFGIALLGIALLGQSGGKMTKALGTGTTFEVIEDKKVRTTLLLRHATEALAVNDG